jgi:arabinofuranan 3-O-arabinosyltransferase
MGDAGDSQRPEEPSPGWGERLADEWQDLLAVGRFLLRPWPRYLACWVLALAFAGFAAREAWTCWDEPKRADGNWGHGTIDFGGQWLMGRMVWEGRGRQLYDRRALQEVLEDAYPRADGDPNDKTDSEKLLDWLIDSRDDNTHLGGALYPPVQGMLFAPLGALPPRTAYRVLQAIVLVLAFVNGWLAERLTAGGVWWPAAAAVLMLFPGFNATINLAQNALLSLTLVAAGWWQLRRGHPWLGGVLWGFLAFKPVWAAAFLLVPLLSRRWKFAAAMVLTGGVLSAATLPLVGWQTWLDWLAVGRLAAADYARQESWIILSRDLLGIPRRWMLHFQDGIARDPQPWGQVATALGLALWLSVVAATATVAVWRRRRMDGFSGPGPAFLLLGAYFACYHFMYYDVMLGALPTMLLFTDPRRAWPLRRMRLLHGPGTAERLAALDPGAAPAGPPPRDPDWSERITTLPPAEGWHLLAPSVLVLVFKPHWLLNLVPPLLLVGMLVGPPLCYLFDPTYHFPPTETFCLLALWAWCGWQVLTTGGDPAAGAPGLYRADG